MQKHESVSLADTHTFLVFSIIKPNMTEKLNSYAVFR
jgi:hypothetical protein